MTKQWTWVPIKITFFESTNYLEYSSNAVAFDYGGANVVIGLSKYSVEDACNKKIRIPSDDWETWKDSNVIKFDQGKKLFRFWKLRAKGFEPYDKKTTDFIISKAREYISRKDNWYPMKKFYCNITYGTNRVKNYAKKPNVSEGCSLSWNACNKFDRRTRQNSTLEKTHL